MAVLVIGGCGFIGTHIVGTLGSFGTESVVFDRNGDPKNNTRFCTYLSGDIGDHGAIERIIERYGIERVIHLVSTTLPKASNEDMKADVAGNVIQTLSLLDAFVRTGIRKILFMSSGGTVYGKPQSLPVSENHPTDPICSYGIGKLAIEKYLALYKHLYGLNYIVLRAANPYGSGQNPLAGQGIIANFVRRILCGMPLEVWGDGRIIRDYLDVRDLAILARLALHSEHCGVFNAGSGVGTSIEDLIRKIAEITHMAPHVIHKEQRIFDVPAIVLDCAKAEKTFGWKAAISLETGLADYIGWYVDGREAGPRSSD